MKTPFLLPLCSVAILITGCASAPKNDDAAVTGKFLTDAFAPIYDISVLRNGALDVVYCSASFRNKNDRWPTNYAELTVFIQQSDGYLMPGHYERVNLQPLANDGLEIRYVRSGRTNEMKFTLGAPKKD